MTLSADQRRTLRPESSTLGDVERALASGAGEEADALPPRPGEQAAVALVLRKSRELELLLIRRAEHEGDPWSGHMALPGGRVDPSDLSLVATAERETLEEVGLDLTREARLLGVLPHIQAVAGGRPLSMVIAPFVYGLRDSPPPALELNHEVAEAIWISVPKLASGTLDTTRVYEHRGARLHLPAWRVRDSVVWGLTHRMVHSLLDRI